MAYHPHSASNGNFTYPLRLAFSTLNRLYYSAMSVYLAHHHVREWADQKTLQSALDLQKQNAVNQLTVDGNTVRASVKAAGHQTYTRFRVLEDGSVLSDCPCPQSQFSGTVCVHVVAAGLALAAMTEDTRRERNLRIAARRKREAATPVTDPTPLSARQATADPTQITATLRLRVPPTWRQDLEADHIAIHCKIEIDGKRIHPHRIKPSRKLIFSESDFETLYILEDIANTTTCPAVIPCTRAQYSDLLHAWTGKSISVLDDPTPLHVSDTPALSALQLQFDATPPAHLILQYTAIPQGTVILTMPQYAWLLHENTLYPLETTLPAEWREAYHHPLRVPPHRILHFLRKTLPLLEDAFPVENETGFGDTPVVTTGTPSFAIQLQGGLDSLEITLLAQYAETYFSVNGHTPSADDAVPDPENPQQFIARNANAERQAFEIFRDLIGQPLDQDAVCNATGQQAMLAVMTDAIPKMEAQGWKIIKDSAFALACDKGSWIETEIHITEHTDEFYRLELHYRDDMGTPVSSEAVEAALSLGHTMIMVQERNLIIDSHNLRALQAALAECTEYRETIACIPRIHAGFIAALAKQHPRLHVVAPPAWAHHAQQLCNRAQLPELSFPPKLESQLRGYQKEGIRWLHFLEQNGYAGILADEMGLGKTVQALAWIAQIKQNASVQRPTMVVCPTSLLVNWGREIERFVPELSYCIVSGGERHKLWDALEQYDIIITSYALLRRDTDRYANIIFAAVVLDEAQHIKNRATQNALAAKRLRAENRLVLTGTPIENSVSDLWSIMDFLMPTYLGSHNSFRIRFEQPVQQSTGNSDKALEHLRCKLSPFMLRRLKIEVAAEMPPKVTRIASTPMHGPQQRLYQRLLASYYEQITTLVDNQGFERSRFSVFSALLRLRQCCCHPALLRQIKGTDEMASAKMDLFFELLDEAMDGGHRVLVFSQFVQMLHILRSALAQRKVPFAYLDGATRNRMEQVDKFNNNPDIPVFLVSLKAGGSGLNLTGANVVIHYDPWWNPAVEDQATDRTHRIGQTQTVYSIKLVTENSIEQKVIELQERKRAIINAAMGTTGGFAQQLTWEDIRELIQP